MLALLVYLEQGKKIQKIDGNIFHRKDLRNPVKFSRKISVNQIQFFWTYPRLHLGFDCNFRFLQMPYFGHQVTIWALGTQSSCI